MLLHARMSCGNCGRDGHHSRECTRPIDSYGVIAFFISGYSEEEHRLLFSDVCKDVTDSDDLRSIDRMKLVGIESPEDLTVYDHFSQQLNFVMITRKDSLGFLEFLRGHYNPLKEDTVVKLFKQMMTSEIKRISIAMKQGPNGFYHLTRAVLQSTNRAKMEEAQRKWDALMTGMIECNGTVYELPRTLKYYVEKIEPSFATPEIGFPAGRRMRHETDIVCAQREFGEETGLEADSYNMMTRLVPVPDSFVGTDGKRYRRSYYLAFLHRAMRLVVDETKVGQKGEIGAVFYCDYNRAMQLIRPYHISKKNALTSVYNYVMNRILTYERAKRNLKLGDELMKIVEQQNKLPTSVKVVGKQKTKRVIKL